LKGSKYNYDPSAGANVLARTLDAVDRVGLFVNTLAPGDRGKQLPVGHPVTGNPPRWYARRGWARL